MGSGLLSLPIAVYMSCKKWSMYLVVAGVSNGSFWLCEAMKFSQANDAFGVRACVAISFADPVMIKSLSTKVLPRTATFSNHSSTGINPLIYPRDANLEK